MSQVYRCDMCKGTFEGFDCWTTPYVRVGNARVSVSLLVRQLTPRPDICSGCFHKIVNQCMAKVSKSRSRKVTHEAEGMVPRQELEFFKAEREDMLKEWVKLEERLASAEADVEAYKAQVEGMVGREEYEHLQWCFEANMRVIEGLQEDGRKLEARALKAEADMEGMVSELSFKHEHDMYVDVARERDRLEEELADARAEAKRFATELEGKVPFEDFERLSVAWGELEGEKERLEGELIDTLASIKEMGGHMETMVPGDMYRESVGVTRELSLMIEELKAEVGALETQLRMGAAGAP